MLDSLHLLRCHVAASAYGFDAQRVGGVHRWESVTSAPASAPSGCIGLLGATPVYSLTYLLGLDEDAEAGAGPVLLLDGFGVQVDSVSRPAQVPMEEFRSLPRAAQSAGGRVQGLARIEGELTLCLNPERIAPFRQLPPAQPTGWPVDEGWEGGSGSDARRILCFLPPGGDDKTFFALSYRQVLEVAQGLTLTRLRTANPCLAGLVDWRKRAVPVVDLAALLGVGASPDVDVSRVVIARSPQGRELFAFPASHLAPVSLPLPEDSIVTRIIASPSGYLRASYGLNDDGYLFLPDLDKVAAA